MNRLSGALVATMLALTGCSGDDDAPDTGASADAGADSTISDTDATTPGRFPDIVDVDATRNDADGTWSFAVTVSSPYDTPERYADGWRVLGPDGTVYGVHTLTHDHAGEQPFTRTQTGVEIPADVTAVTIEGRDLINGFGGTTLTIDLQAGTP